jgi:hypothetical protein
MREKSLDAILDGVFNHSADDSPDKEPLTLWLPSPVIEKYRQVQQQHDRRLTPALKEVATILIDRAYERVAG